MRKLAIIGFILSSLVIVSGAFLFINNDNKCFGKVFLLSGLLGELASVFIFTYKMTHNKN